jgi:hypothetical protein
MTTRPSGMRAELREWCYDEERLCWEGEIHDDVTESFRDGQPVRFPASSVREVVEYKDYDVLVTHNGGHYFMSHSTRLFKPG